MATASGTDAYCGINPQYLLAHHSGAATIGLDIRAIVPIIQTDQRPPA
jgi:hypothetical protein